MKRLRIAPQARLDLDEIWLYIAEGSIEAADRVAGELLDKLLLLASQPLIGRERPEIAVGVRSFPICSL